MQTGSPGRDERVPTHRKSAFHEFFHRQRKRRRSGKIKSIDLKERERGLYTIKFFGDSFFRQRRFKLLERRIRSDVSPPRVTHCTSVFYVTQTRLDIATK